MLTGLPGDGKSSVAIQLLLHYKETHEIVKLHSVEEWESQLDHEKNQIFLLDDVFGKTFLDKINLLKIQELIDKMKNFIDDKTLVVLSSETSTLKEVHPQFGNAVPSENIVDLSVEFKLSKEEKKNLLKQYIRCNTISNDIEKIHGNVDRFVESVSEEDCPGYPECVVLFTNPQNNLIENGVNLFRFPFKYLNKTLDRLYEKNPNIYATMLLLALQEGRMLEDDLEDALEKSSTKTLLEAILSAPVSLDHSRIKCIIEEYDGIYFKRFLEEGVVGFYHNSFMKAICLNFGNRFKEQAIVYLPFEFALENFRTSSYDGNERVIKLKPETYQYLADKITDEILSGNIQLTCQHQACTDKRFTKTLMKIFIEQHKKSKNGKTLSPFLLMERELEIRETFNGSILYWASVSGSEALCADILETGVLKTIPDKLWIKIQASAALVHACAHAFSKSTIQGLLDLEANVLCQNLTDKSYSIRFCDSCNVFNENGTSPLQLTAKNNKQEILELFLNKLSDEDKRKGRSKIIMEKSLREAIFQNNTKAAETLFLYCDLDRTVKNENHEYQRSCLWYAVRNQNIALVEKILQSRELTSGSDEFGENVLKEANNLELIKFLISKGASIGMKDEDGKTVLFFAQDPTVAAYYIESEKLDVNENDNNGLTPLHFFVKQNRCDIVLTLFCHGANPFTVDSRKRYPLHMVQSQELSEIVCKQMLLKNQQKAIEVMELVLSCVLDSDVLINVLHHLKEVGYSKTQILEEALLSHAKNGTLSSDLLTFFVKEKVDINACNNYGNILHHLCTICQKKHNKNIISKLENMKINANETDSDGNTPLHIACALTRLSPIEFRTRPTIIQHILN